MREPVFSFPYHHPRRPWRPGIFGGEFPAELGLKIFQSGKTFPPFQDWHGFKMFHNKHPLLLKIIWFPKVSKGDIKSKIAVAY